MEQFVKVEKKECAEKDQSEPQNIVTETLAVPLPTETPHKSCLEKPVTIRAMCDECIGLK